MIEGIETVVPLSYGVILLRLKCREYKKALRGGQTTFNCNRGGD